MKTGRTEAQETEESPGEMVLADCFQYDYLSAYLPGLNMICKIKLNPNWGMLLVGFGPSLRDGVMGWKLGEPPNPK